MRRLFFVLALSAAACFRPQVPSGKVTCNVDSQCPSGQTCKPVQGDVSGLRLCCGPDGCGGSPTVAADAAGVTVDAAPRADAPATPDGAVVSGEVPVPTDGGAPDVARAFDTAPPGPDIAAMAVCAKPINTAFSPSPTRKSYCTVGVRDTQVLLNLDLIDNDDPLTIASFQICQVPLDLAAKTTPLPGQPPPPLPAADKDMLSAIAGFYHRLCTDMHVDNFVGIYGTGWARQTPNIGEVGMAVKAATGVDLEVLTTAQETTQRYLGASGSRQGYLVLHARADDLALTWWPRGDAGPSEVLVPTNMRIAEDRYFGSNSGYFSYSSARNAYENAIENDLRGQLNTWRNLMGGVPRLVDNLVLDADDATYVLAVRNQLRSNNGNWDDVDAYKMELAEAPATLGKYGWSYGILLSTQARDFAESIFNTREFSQLRNDPIKSAYGLKVMALGGFIHELTDALPLGEMGAVSTNFSYGYVFRKLFMAQ